MMKPELFFYLLLSWCFVQNGDCHPPKSECAHVSCLACLDHYKAETVEGECCPRCIPLCSCPPFLVEECGKDGTLLLGESVYIDYANKRCTCVSAGKIKCVSVCPKIPPTCQYIETPIDGCGMCACPTEKGNFVLAGKNITEECQICECPLEGGKLQCKPTCKKFA